MESLLSRVPNHFAEAKVCWKFAESQQKSIWKSGLFRKVHCLENLESLEILESSQTLENKGESDHWLEIREN